MFGPKDAGRVNFELSRSQDALLLPSHRIELWEHFHLPLHLLAEFRVQEGEPVRHALPALRTLFPCVHVDPAVPRVFFAILTREGKYMQGRKMIERRV